MNRFKYSLLILLVAFAPIGSRAETVSATGITEPVLVSTLGSPVAGIIAARKHQEGEFVKKGEVIIELDRKLEELEAERRQLMIKPLKQDFERERELSVRTISVSKQDLEKKETDFQVATVEHQLAAEQLRRRQVVAPFDGVITELFVEIGEAAQAQQQLARIVDTRRCYFIANVEAKAGRELKVGQNVNLEVDNGPKPVRLAGKISFVSPVVDPASGLFRVKAIFDNTEGKVRPGVAGTMFFENGTGVQ